MIVLLGKVTVVILFFMLTRWSWPRFRFDQLMALAWKVMLPLGLVNLVVVAAWIEFGDTFTSLTGLPAVVGMFLCGWAVLIASWLIVVLATPTNCDNRPRMEQNSSPEITLQ